MTIGNNIKALRKRKKLKQKELAELVGVAQSTLCDWESDTSQPRSKNLDALANALGVRRSRIFA